MTLGDLTQCGSRSTKSTSTTKYATVVHQKMRNASPCQSSVRECVPTGTPQKGEREPHRQLPMLKTMTGRSATRLNQSCTSRARFESCRRGPSILKASSTWKWSSIMLLAFLSVRSAYTMPSCTVSSAASLTSSPSIVVNSRNGCRFFHALGDAEAIANTSLDSCSARVVRDRTAGGVFGSACAALLASSAATTARRAASLTSDSSAGGTMTVPPGAWGQ
mmetsp:Transcript_19368/g.56224  ORF Transcript_19368/g.56224 Transcript_19368/m.56224 type:complete len:220 (+) Transcript_19368:508-1167(+)